MKHKTKGLMNNIKKSVLKGIYYTIPFAISGGALISLAYLTDIFTGADAAYGLGDSNPVAAILKSIGSFAFGLMLPVLSGVTASELAGKNAFIAGIVSGYIAQSGATLLLPRGDTTSVSGYIGAIVAGIGAGLTVKFIKKILSKSTAFANNTKGLFEPVLSVLLSSILVLIINPLAGIVNTLASAALMSISEGNPIAFGAILGALSAIDLGGAFSKAAFIFATAAITTGEYTAMAVVMAAGMTVPLSVALSSMIFSVKFSGKEKKLARANLLFGLCSVPEGAIPIAAKSPTRVLPACTAAASVSGALSAGFGCTLIAPYGGILLLPVTGRPLLFLLSIFTGTLVGAVILGIFKEVPKNAYSY